jgi:integrating conjugative element protein (TIGR03757 family)
MKIKKILFLCLIIPTLIFAENNVQIEVFTDSANPVIVSNIPNVHYYNLDAAQNLIYTLNNKMHGVPENRAPQVAEKLFLQNKDNLENAYLGLLKAKQYRLEKYPAVVIDGKAIIYGVKSVEKAVTEYKKWLR